LNHIFISQRVRRSGNVGAFLGSKYDLGLSFPISEVDEDDASMVPR
jgi:hypothetical protein